MDEAGMMSSELEPQAPEPTTEAELAQEPEVAAAPEPEPEPAPDAQPELFPEAVPAHAEAPSDRPIEPTLDEMVASIAGAAAEVNAVPAEATELIELESADVMTPGDETPSGADDEAPAVTESTEDAGEEPVADVVAVVATDEAPVEEAPAEPVPFLLQMRWRVPFWVVFGVFAAFVAAVVYLLWPASTGEFVALPLYGVLVIGGASLVLIDLVTGLAVWLTARSRAVDDEKVGLGRTLWARAFAWTAGGVALWWIGILVLDLHRAGVLG